MIDSTLKREIKTSLYGKGDRPSKFEALAKLRAAKADLSSPAVMTSFNNCMSKDGRELEINIVSGKCSCCQHYAEQVNILPPIMKYSICPNCGALMQDE